MATRADELDALQAAYARFVSSRDGQTIMADLEKRFYDVPMTGADLNREVGRRDVVLYMKQVVKRNGRE